jgi:hypothetical protein
LPLEQRRLQFRADDEEETLVKSCKIHGTQYHILESYNKIVDSPLLNDDLLSNFARTPSYMIPCLGNMREIGECRPMMVVECIIKLSGIIRDFYMVGELIQCNCEYTRSCWSTKSGIEAGILWKDNNIFSDIASTNLVRESSILINDGIISRTSLISINGLSPVFKSNCSISDYFEMIKIEREDIQNGVKCYLKLNSTETTYFLAFLSFIKDHDVEEYVAKYPALASKICSILLNDMARVPRSYNWKFWRELCMLSVYFDSSVYIQLSDFNLGCAFLPDSAGIREQN